MSDISAAVRARVVSRAKNRCEHCGLAQAGQEAAFHVDHVVPRNAGGVTTEPHLALACVSCSLNKAAKQSAVDSVTAEEYPLFNARLQNWSDHFQWDGNTATGLTPIGWATVTALRMNRALIIAIREDEQLRGRHPYPQGLP